MSLYFTRLIKFLPEWDESAPSSGGTSGGSRRSRGGYLGYPLGVTKSILEPLRACFQDWHRLGDPGALAMRPRPHLQAWSWGRTRLGLDAAHRASRRRLDGDVAGALAAVGQAMDLGQLAIDGLRKGKGIQTTAEL